MPFSGKFYRVCVTICRIILLMAAALCLPLGIRWTELPCPAIQLLGLGLLSIGTFCAAALLRIIVYRLIQKI